MLTFGARIDYKNTWTNARKHGDILGNIVFVNMRTTFWFFGGIMKVIGTVCVLFETLGCWVCYIWICDIGCLIFDTWIFDMWYLENWYLICDVWYLHILYLIFGYSSIHLSRFVQSVRPPRPSNPSIRPVRSSNPSVHPVRPVRPSCPSVLSILSVWRAMSCWPASGVTEWRATSQAIRSWIAKEPDELD